MIVRREFLCASASAGMAILFGSSAKSNEKSQWSRLIDDKFLANKKYTSGMFENGLDSWGMSVTRDYSVGFDYVLTSAGNGGFVSVCNRSQTYDDCDFNIPWVSKNCKLHMDQIGTGSAIYDRMKKGTPDINGVILSNKTTWKSSKNTNLNFCNMRTAMLWKLKEYCEKGIVLVGGKDTISGLRDVYYKMDGNTVFITPASEVKNNSHVISMSLAVWGLKSTSTMN